jgi:hypothetical protein
MLQTGILGICVLQGFLGFTAIGHADQLITVSQDPLDGANCDTITGAVADAAEILATQPQPVVIEVLDEGPYYESVSITDIPTTAAATLTLESSALGGTTIHTPIEFVEANSGARPLTITRTDFVTIQGFIFMKDVPSTLNGITTLVKFDTYAPTESQVTFDNCVWDGQGLTYTGGAILFCRYSHCNITVTNSTFQNIVSGTNWSTVYLGWRSIPMANTPTFTFRNNEVINNTDAMVQLEGDAANGYYHNLIIERNVFTGNEGDFDLLFIRNQRAAKDISHNSFFGNTLSGIHADVFSGMTLALINSGSATVAGNTFIQNGAMAEVFVQDSSAATTKLAGNLIAASPGIHFGVWADLGSKTVLQSSGNPFYSNYSTKDPWNTARTDCVAAWGNGKVALTLDKWNAKTPKDGSDSLAAPGKLPPTP